MKKLTVMIPCYNEEKGVAQVIKNIPKKKLRDLGYKTEVLVIDNNSSDNTTKVAKKAGAKVVFEGKQGKGNAIQRGIKNISRDTDVVVMLDGDDTYKAQEMLRLVEPLDSGFCDVVIGSRLNGKIYKGSMSNFNLFGNKVLTWLVQAFYKRTVEDVCTGYFAWRKPVIKKLSRYLNAKGFSIEMDMITKMAKMNYSIYSVPISYENRAGDSSLKPIRDGTRILSAWGRNLLWKPGVVAR